MSAVPQPTVPPRVPCIYTVRFFYGSPERCSFSRDVPAYAGCLCDKTAMSVAACRGGKTKLRSYLANQYSRFTINFENKQLNATASALSVQKTDHPSINWPTTPLDDDFVSARVFIATARRLFVSATKQ